MRGARRLAGLTFAVAILFPVPAGAATTVGSSLRQRADLYLRCSGLCTAVQSARPGGAGLVVPSDGVVTRWRLRAATMGTVRLRVVRREADGGYTSVASSDWVKLDRPHEPGHDILYEFPVRLPVHAGDALAVDRDAKAGGIFHSYGDNSSYAVAEFAPALAEDAAGVQPTSVGGGRELLANADVEKDADGDGFGDESQDNCPTIPNDQTDKPCSTPAPEGPSSTPVETNPQTHTPGSAGPPAAGEPRLDRSKRRHSGRHRARKSPPRATDPQRRHGRRHKARATPRRPSGPDSRGHADQPRPRKAPAERQRPAAKHPAQAPRPKPPRPHTPSGGRHERTGARPAPRSAPQRTHRHRAKPVRPAPRPTPAPGWRRHTG